MAKTEPTSRQVTMLEITVCRDEWIYYGPDMRHCCSVLIPLTGSLERSVEDKQAEIQQSAVNQTSDYDAIVYPDFGSQAVPKMLHSLIQCQ